MTSTRRHRLLLAAALTTSPLAATRALAQVAGPPAVDSAGEAAKPDSGRLQDIVVTAQRRSERLQNVPIAVTALTADAVAAKGVTSTLDVAVAVPGLTYTRIIGTAAPRIRGIGTVSALAGNENSVATYVDGVYYASSGSSVLSLSNIAQIAVLKGPQGTLFGRNATGGLIQITTLDPKQEFSGNLTATYGNKNTIGATTYITGGLTKGIAADLAIAYNNQQDGFGRNLTTGREVGSSRNLTIRSKIMFDIGPATTVKLNGDYSTLSEAGPVRRPPYNELIVGHTYFTGGPFDVISNIDPYFGNEQGGGSINLVRHLGGVDLVSISAYRKATTRVIFDIDNTQLPLSNTNNVFKDSQFTQELQLISTASGPFNWTLGAFYFNGKGGYDRVVLNLPPVVQRFQSYQHTRSPAVYGQGTYKLSPATSLTVGLRYSMESRDFDAAGTVFAKATGVTTTPAPIHDNISFNRPTWRFALDHRFGEGLLGYVSYNRGFKSGGYNGAVFFPAPQTFRPEVLDAYEVGMKLDALDRRLRINAAAFYYDYQDIQLTSFIGGIVQISNATKAKIYGLDADVTLRPVDRLTLTAALSYLHTRFGYFPNAQVSTPLPAGGVAIGSGDATGNHVPLAPDWTLSLGADYDVPLQSGSLRLSTQYFHSDGYFAESDNRLRQAPYNLLNGSVTWRIGDAERFSISVFGRNLTNEVYAATLSTQNTADTYVPAPGRTFGLTLGVKF